MISFCISLRELGERAWIRSIIRRLHIVRKTTTHRDMAVTIIPSKISKLVNNSQMFTSELLLNKWQPYNTMKMLVKSHNNEMAQFLQCIKLQGMPVENISTVLSSLQRIEFEWVLHYVLSKVNERRDICLDDDREIARPFGLSYQPRKGGLGIFEQ